MGLIETCCITQRIREVGGLDISYNTKKFFWGTPHSNDHNFLSFWTRTKFLVSRIFSCSRSLHLCEKFSNFGTVGHPTMPQNNQMPNVIQPKGRLQLVVVLRHGRVPHGPEIRKLLAKTKRSRTGEDPRYQKLCSTRKTKKVVIV